MKGVTKDSMWLSIGTIGASVIGFLQTIFLSNNLSPETFGTFRYVISLVGTLGIFALPGLTTAVYQSLSKGNNPNLAKLNKNKFLLSLVGSLSALLFSLWKYGNGEIGTGDFYSYLIIVILFPFSEYLNIYEPIALANKKYRFVSFINIASRLGVGILTIVVSIIKPDIVYLTAAFFLATILIKIYALRKTLLKNSSSNFSDTKETEKYSWKLTLVSTINIIGTYFDKIFIFNSLGPASLALYSMSTIFADQGKVLVKQIGTVELKNLVHISINESLSYIKERTDTLLLMLIPFYILYVACIYVFFHFFPKYDSAFFLAVVYGLVILLSTKTYHRAFLEAHKQSKKLLIFNIISMASKIIGVLILVRPLGILGIVIGVVISELITWIVLEFLILHFVRHHSK